MDYQIAKQDIDKFLKIDEEQRQREDKNKKSRKDDPTGGWHLYRCCSPAFFISEDSKAFSAHEVGA